MSSSSSSSSVDATMIFKTSSIFLHLLHTCVFSYLRLKELHAFILAFSCRNLLDLFPPSADYQVHIYDDQISIANQNDFFRLIETAQKKHISFQELHFSWTCDAWNMNEMKNVYDYMRAINLSANRKSAFFVKDMNLVSNNAVKDFLFVESQDNLCVDLVGTLNIVTIRNRDRLNMLIWLLKRHNFYESIAFYSTFFPFDEEEDEDHGDGNNFYLKEKDILQIAMHYKDNNYLKCLDLYCIRMDINPRKYDFTPKTFANVTALCGHNLIEFYPPLQSMCDEVLDIIQQNCPVVQKISLCTIRERQRKTEKYPHHGISVEGYLDFLNKTQHSLQFLWVERDEERKQILTQKILLKIFRACGPKIKSIELRFMSGLFLNERKNELFPAIHSRGIRLNEFKLSHDYKMLKFRLRNKKSFLHFQMLHPQCDFCV